MTLCEVVHLYQSDDDLLCGLNCDALEPGPCDYGWHYVGSKNCGELTGNVDYYINVRVQLSTTVLGPVLGTISGGVTVSTIRAFTDFSPPVLMITDACHRGSTGLTQPCDGASGGNCYLQNFLGDATIPDECFPLFSLCTTELLVECCTADGKNYSGFEITLG